jgi:uncharacterized protein (TIGR02145 family)/prepilin-type N-terminal cleavage/methylation domain-containing protein
MDNTFKKQKAFTLLEIILVVAAISILAGIVILALNPFAQLAKTRDAQRTADIREINNALVQYQIDHRELPITFPNDLTEICDTGNRTWDEVPSSDCDGYINLSFLVSTYLVAIPRDPSLVSDSMLIDTAFAALGGNGYRAYLKNSRFRFFAEEYETAPVSLNIDEEELASLIGEGGNPGGGEGGGDDDPAGEPSSCTSGSLTYQGEAYPTVSIGNQCWFAKNLNAFNYRNGDEIAHPNGNPKWFEWDNLIGKWSYLNNGNGDNNAIYGKLYNWYAIEDSRGLCPSGWHVPTVSDWNTLSVTLSSEQGKKMKVGASYDPPWDGNNSSGFSALPGGIRWVGGSFSHWGVAYFWSSDDVGDVVHTIQLSSWNDNMVRVMNGKSEGLSVRCLKD